MAPLGARSKPPLVEVRNLPVNSKWPRWGHDQNLTWAWFAVTSTIANGPVGGTIKTVGGIKGLMRVK